jgi:glycosyltransferase involved in cell wall biosynthesis
MNPGITVVIPSIPPRSTYLKRAVESVLSQTQPAAGISLAIDLGREGAAVTRQRGLEGVKTEWTAFLDDDDWFYPEHLETLFRGAAEYGADYVFSYYMVHDFTGRPRPDIDPLENFGKVFDSADPHQTTITTLVRTELAQEVGFHNPPEGEMINHQKLGEDFQFTTGCIAAGGKIVHIPERSWAWSHHGSNTSGVPTW